MDEQRIGQALRAIRRHKRWTLHYAATRAGLSAATASRIENGRLDLCSSRAVRAYAQALGADLDMWIRWRGGDLDRLLSRRHASMHERMARWWHDLPEWRPLPEHSFSIFGERGIIDWFAWHKPTRTVLTEELKSQFVDVQELVGTNERRVRLAPRMARELGWDPLVVASWVLVDDTRTNRRHLAQHATFLRTAFPADGRTMTAWLRNPNGPIRCLSFLPPIREAKPGRTRRGRLVMPDGQPIPPARDGDETLAGTGPQLDAERRRDERFAGFLRS